MKIILIKNEGFNLKYYLFIRKNFKNVSVLKKYLIHTNSPGQYIEVDNLAQKNKTVFVFEGKQTREAEAVKQLQDGINL